jgi:triosephosphate isomerase
MKRAPARKRLVVANWKMNPDTLSKAVRLFAEVKKQAARRARVETVIAPPFPYIASLAGKAGTAVALGAQDVFWEREGTYTGEVSVPMLASVGASHVIIGHSERRLRGETDEQIARKVAAAVKEKLTVVLCVGESDRDATGGYLSVVEEQLRAACASVPKASLKHLAIAYEPVWAISSGDGKGKTATPGDVQEMTIFIRKVLTSIYDRPSADRVRVLYGGSVNEDNAAELMDEGMADGFLVGGASLKPLAFASILSAANR